MEQRSEEGTGEELFAQIQEEKKRLIAEKKIKKEKPLPEITEDEKPFDIPESWIWVRLSQIWSILNGDRGKNYPAKSTLSKTGIPFISAINLNGKTVVEDENLLCLSQIQYDKLVNGHTAKCSILTVPVSFAHTSRQQSFQLCQHFVDFRIEGGSSLLILPDSVYRVKDFFFLMGIAA